MGRARRSILAGSWYPGTSRECKRQISEFLEAAEDDLPAGADPIAGIVPHAGWQFSGKIACRVIHRLAQDAVPDVCAVFGMHLHPNSPAYLMKAGAWETPLGELAIAESLAESLAERHDFQIETEADFIQDNTIELQLPFIKHFMDGAKILPIGVPPRASSLEIGRSVVEISERLGLTLRIIGSTDLTHYGRNYGFTPKGSGSDAVDWVRNENDRRMIDTMVRLDPEAVILSLIHI